MKKQRFREVFRPTRDAGIAVIASYRARGADDEHVTACAARG